RIDLLPSRGDGNTARFGVGNGVFAAANVPHAPGCDHLEIRRERGVRQLEAYLIVALAGAAMRQSVGADLARDLDLTAREQGTSHGSPQEVLAIVDRAGAERWIDEGLDELFAQIFDEALVGARSKRLGANPAQLVRALADIAGDADDAAAGVVLLEPGNDDGGVESAGVGEDNGAGHSRS